MILNPTLADRADALGRQFREAAPFRHLVLDDFFEAAFAESLVSEFPEFEDRFALNESGHVGGKAVRQDVANLADPFRQLDALIQQPEFLELIEKISGVSGLRYDPDYVGGGTHENRSGQGLEPHVDFNYHPRTGQHRRLNLIVYLNPEWREEWGGCIEFHSNPWSLDGNEVERVLPILNRAVLFETNEHSWHGFEPIRHPAGQRLSRRSFAIYLYTDERPAEETAPDHATVYVPLRVPDGFEPGHTLTNEDVTELRRVVQAGLGQLEFLYEREKRFSDQVDHLRRALADAQARVQLPIEGFARVDGPTSGLWADGWTGRRFETRFTPTRNAEGLCVTVFVPEGHGDELAATFNVGGTQIERTLRAGEIHRCELAGLELPAGRTVDFALDCGGTWCPADEGAGDGRALGLLLQRIEVQPA